MTDLPETNWRPLASAIKMVCRHCGGENVTRDAVVRWNIANQCWEVSNIFDNADCDDCEGETKLNEVPL